MKKLFYISALAALALAGCAKNEVVSVSNSDGDAISFQVYTGRAVTKADATNVVNVDTIARRGFGVFGFYTAQAAYASGTHTTPNFMNNQKVTATKVGVKLNWTYSPIKYWPNNVDDKVSFFAYAPYSDTVKWNASNPYISYTVNQDVLGQTDLLFAAGKIDLVKNKAAGIKVDSTIQFQFTHALARIGFKVAYAVDTTNVNDKYTIDAATNIVIDSVVVSPASGNFYNFGNLDMTKTTAADAWTGQTSNYANYVLGAKNNFINSTAATVDRPFGQSVTGSYEQLNNANSYLMIIPQDLSTTGMNVWVQYHVWTKDSKLSATAADQYSKITNKITTKINQNFEAGKAYTLQLLLGMTSVKVSAEVKDWDDVTASTVDLPANQ